MIWSDRIGEEASSFSLDEPLTRRCGLPHAQEKKPRYLGMNYLVSTQNACRASREDFQGLTINCASSKKP